MSQSSAWAREKREHNRKYNKYKNKKKNNKLNVQKKLVKLQRE
jgi:hypothetical protein